MTTTNDLILFGVCVVLSHAKSWHSGFWYGGRSNGGWFAVKGCWVVMVSST